MTTPSWVTDLLWELAEGHNETCQLTQKLIELVEKTHPLSPGAMLNPLALFPPSHEKEVNANAISTFEPKEFQMYSQLISSSNVYVMQWYSSDRAGLKQPSGNAWGMILPQSGIYALEMRKRQKYQDLLRPGAE